MRPSFLDEMSWAMAEVYGAVTDRILVNLARYFPYIRDGEEPRGGFEYQTRMLAQMGQVNRETVDIIVQSLGGADEALRQALEAAILDALKNEEPKLRKAAEQGLLNGPSLLPPEIDPAQMRTFEQFYKQSADKLNLVNTVMLESTQEAYRATVADVEQRIQRTQSILNVAAGETVTGVSTYNQAMHDAVRKMVANGLTGFVDHGGHRWTPEAYVAMDIRTTMFNTARSAINEEGERFGCDFYQVSTHRGARPLCYPWQGKVISRSGWTGTIEDLDGNTVQVHSESEIESFRYGGGLFGVNCGHYPMNFIPGVSTIKGEPQDPEENEKTYAESQQQRALERKLREERRELAVMKAQGADEQAIKAQRAKVKQASEDIDKFCDETGRARRRDREYTPVNATWPDKQTWGDVSKHENSSQNVASKATQNGGNVVQYIKAQTPAPVAYSISDAKQYVAPIDINSGANYPLYKGDANVYELPDGTKFYFKKGLNKKHQHMTPEIAIQEWYKVPQALRDMGQKDIYFVDRYNPADSYWKKTYKNFTHSYATGGNDITFYRYDYDHDLDYFRRSFSHEIGHHVDWALGGSQRYSEMTEWQDAINADYAASGKKSITTYGENSASEDFAESIAEYIIDDQKFTQTMPNRGSLLQKIINGKGNGP